MLIELLYVTNAMDVFEQDEKSAFINVRSEAFAHCASLGMPVKLGRV